MLKNVKFISIISPNQKQRIEVFLSLSKINLLYNDIIDSVDKS